MSALPWVRFFPSDWLAGTRGMTAAEMGVYISLISMMYERGEPLAEDFPRLARLCGASNSQFKKTLDGLLADGKLTRKDGGLWNDRVEKEQSYRSEKSEVGKRAAGQRWQKSDQNQRQSDASAMRSQCEGNANQKPEARDNPATPNGVSAPKGNRGSRLGDFLPDLDLAVSMGLSPEKARFESEKFIDHFRSAPGQKGVKLDWPAAWRNWIRRQLETPSRSQGHRHEQRHSHVQRGAAGVADHLANIVAREQLREPSQPDREGQLRPADRVQDRELSLERGEDGSFGGGGYGAPRLVAARNW